MSDTVERQHIELTRGLFGMLQNLLKICDGQERRLEFLMDSHSRLLNVLSGSTTETGPAETGNTRAALDAVKAEVEELERLFRMPESGEEKPGEPPPDTLDKSR